MSYVKGRLSDYIGDRIVYRNLVPSDPALPPLVDVWDTIGLDRFRVPRKSEPHYAAMIVHLLKVAQEKRGLPPLRDLLFIGDTAMNDGTAARNIGEHLPLRGFIGADRLKEEEKITFDGTMMIANRWKSLGIGTAFFDLGRCLPWGPAIPCIVCQEVCPTSPKAIWLEPVEVPARDGRLVRLQRPHMDPARCVGCGLCEAKCPVSDLAAVRVTRVGESRARESSLTLPLGRTLS